VARRAGIDAAVKTTAIISGTIRRRVERMRGRGGWEMDADHGKE
jgi:hypothetical protein